MATRTAAVETVIEHDGLLWKPKPGTSVTAEQFIAARTLIVEVHRDARWNPWVRGDREADLDAAMDVFEQWTRAEPGFRQKTSKHFDAWMARRDREFEAKKKLQGRQRERNKKRYDPDREQARRALLEDQAREVYLLAEIEEYRSGQTFPGLAAERKQADVAKLEHELQECRQRIETGIAVLGDPETVMSENGWLPPDRRELNLWRYSWRREQEVRRLRGSTKEKQDALKQTKDRTERAEIRSGLREEQADLDRWLNIPPLSPDDMCSECSTPMVDHGWRLTKFTGPCWAWPRAAAQRQKFREMFDEMVRTSQPPPPPPPPKPEPLAVIPSGLPIADVMARLAELQAEFPDSVVKRGRASRWELWPSESGS